MARPSLHEDPTDLRSAAQHYLRDLVYGANDGLITTFAVVAGVAGGELSVYAVLVVGVANLLADGLSMGAGNYLSIRSNEGARAARGLPQEEARPALHGLATFLAFVLAGVVPLLPYAVPILSTDRFAVSVALTLATLFAVGAARSLVTIDRVLTSGIEMLLLGAVVAGVAYGSGALVARLVL